MYRQHVECRACGLGKPELPTLKQVCGSETFYAKADALIPVFDLGVQPLANDFCADDEERAGWAPLKVLMCPRCGLSQLSVTVDPNVLYRHYCYVTSPSSTMQAHLEKLAKDIQAEAGFDSLSLLEIGSNDGRLLRQFKGYGFEPQVGIDPAENLGQLARLNDTATLTDLFTEKSAAWAKSMLMGEVDVILARHVFCHVDNWKAFVEAAASICHDETIVCIEVPYVQDLLDHNEWDTIYAEHTSYLSVRAVQALLEDTPLRLHRIIRYAIHGGAILLILRTRKSAKLQDKSVKEFLAAENVTPDSWARLQTNANESITALRNYVKVIREGGKKVAALGASAKSTVWINACKFTKSDISFIADSTAQKLYRTSPGTNIPIVDEGAILRDLPAFVICFAWNFREEIMQKNKMAWDKGVKFIFPVPTLQVV